MTTLLLRLAVQIRSYQRDERGATTVEYALLIVAVAAACVFFALGVHIVKDVFAHSAEVNSGL